MLVKKILVSLPLVLCLISPAFSGDGDFDMDRWYSIIEDVRTRAAQKNISQETIDATTKSPAFIPSIVKSDKNQAEFKLTLDSYLSRVVSANKISSGLHAKAKYPTLLSRMEKTYGVPRNVILAFWGLESNYGEIKARHKLVDAFFTLMYDGRREKFFGDQLLALMKIADDNHLDINSIRGSWAGAMGHFQFIPTTLAMYGTDGDADGRIDVINNITDAMASAGNYLNKLGWNSQERIARRVKLPADFDRSLLDGKTKKSLASWAKLGVVSADGTPLPTSEMVAGLVADVENLDASLPDDFNPDVDDAPMPVFTAYLTYPNFYRIKRWNNSNWYALAICELADKLK